MTNDLSTKEEAPPLGADGACENEHLDRSSGDAERKAFATLQAALALAGGFALNQLADGSFLVSRWNLTRPLSNLEAVRRFAVQVGAL